MEFDDQLDGRVVLLGATGYTGRLTAMRMVAQGRAPVLVGRDQEKLQRLIEELLPLAPSGREPDWAIADVNERGDLLGLLRSEADVLVSTVGPFTRLGQAPVEAAIDAGAAYLDCTGEPAFVKKIFTDYDRRARRTGARLLTAFGFDYVPGNLAAGLLLERNEASAIEQVDIGYFVTGNFTPSSGTIASATGVALESSYTWRDGELASERAGSRTLDFDLAGRTLTAVSIGGTEQFALPRSYPQLRTINTQVGWIGRWSRAWSTAGVLAGGAMQVPGVGSAMGAVMRTALGGVSDTGPADHQRAANRSHVLAVGRDGAGVEIDRVQVDGPDPYDMTADLLDWGAALLQRRQDLPVGALGPIDGLGLDRLQAGCLALGIADVR